MHSVQSNMTQLVTTASNKRKRRDSSPSLVEMTKDPGSGGPLVMMMQTVATTNKRRQEDAAPPVVNGETVQVQDFVDLIVRTLHIKEILEKVMAYVPVSDLQSVRLVCQKWNDLGAEVMEARATLQLPKKKKLPSRLFNSVAIIGIDVSFGPRFLTTFHNLFQKEGKNVKNLTIDNKQLSDCVEIYKEIFDTTMEVETLCLKWLNVKYECQADAKTLFKGKFLKLKSLEIGNLRPQLTKNCPADTSLVDNEAVVFNWIEHLFRTNITSLQLRFTNYKTLKICDQLLLKEATKHELLPKLECAEIGGETQTAGLNFLLHLNGPLKKICFQDLSISNYYYSGYWSHSSLLEQVLKKHAESLEALHILSLHPKYCPLGETVFHWPLLPKLKHLNVGVKPPEMRDLAASIEKFESFYIFFKQSAGLKTGLPNLEQLTLDFQYDGFLEMFNELLFLFADGSEDKTFPQIKKLEVISSMIDKDLTELRSGWSKIFPNAGITLLPSNKPRVSRIKIC